MGTSSLKLICDINIRTCQLRRMTFYTKERSKIPTLSMPAIIISVNTIVVVMLAVFVLPRAPHSHHMAFVTAHWRISDGIWPVCMLTG